MNNVLNFLPIELWLKVFECTDFDSVLQATCKFFSQPDFLAKEETFFASLWSGYEAGRLSARVKTINENSLQATHKEKVKALYQGLMKDAKEHKVPTKIELSIRIYTLSIKRLEQIQECLSADEFISHCISLAPIAAINNLPNFAAQMNPNWRQTAQRYLDQIKNQSNGQ